MRYHFTLSHTKNSLTCHSIQIRDMCYYFMLSQTKNITDLPLHSDLLGQPNMWLEPLLLLWGQLPLQWKIGRRRRPCWHISKLDTILETNPYSFNISHLRPWEELEITKNFFWIMSSNFGEMKEPWVLLSYSQ